MSNKVRNPFGKACKNFVEIEQNGLEDQELSCLAKGSTDEEL